MPTLAQLILSAFDSVHTGYRGNDDGYINNAEQIKPKIMAPFVNQSQQQVYGEQNHKEEVGGHLNTVRANRLRIRSSRV